MPKCYSEQEKEYIRQRLKEEAAKSLAQYGVRRTTVDDLVKRVKIPKGTFYLFYQSKELLLFEVLNELHEAVETQLFQEMKKLGEQEVTAEGLTDVLLKFYLTSMESPLLRMMNSDEVELLARKLPPEVLAAHAKEDGGMIEKLIKLLHIEKEVDVEVVSAAFRAIYLLTVQRESIGESIFEDMLRFLIHGVVIQLI